jgi:hypothetical protein
VRRDTWTRRAVPALAGALALSWVLVSAAPRPSAPGLTGDGLVRAVAAGADERAGATGAHATITDVDHQDVAATDEDVVVTVEVSAAGPTLRLERRDGGRWTPVAEEVAETTAVALPVPSRAGDATYRVVLDPGTGTVRTSPELTIFQSDSQEHAAYVARARAAVRDFCPLTPIYVDSPDVRSGQTVGKARSSWAWADGQARWTQSIRLRSGLPDAVLEHTALHECAHVVQVRPLVDGESAYEESTASAERLYARGPAEPGELQADCMASVITGRTAVMYYARTCTARQKADARAMWRDYGSVRQSPSLTWAWKG